jgi:diguanylate cyclase (GGDEF)-like protein
VPRTWPLCIVPYACSGLLFRSILPIPLAMQSSRSSFDQYMRRIPDSFQLAIGLGLVAALTAFKLTIGQSVTLIDFLFVPVVWVGWFASARWYGYAVAAVAAALSIMVAVVAETQASLAAASAAGIARFGLYLVVLALLGMMRRERAGHQHAVATDQQTGAANARAFRAIALGEVERAQRYQHELSLAYLDVDDFKAINDLLGHPEGDRVLAEVSHMMRSTVRSTDTVARIGGDEFAILMPETGMSSARAVIDRVRDEIARLRTLDAAPVPCSIGLVTFACPPASLKELVVAGDELLYLAKANGKDRVEQAERSGSFASLSRV